MATLRRSPYRAGLLPFTIPHSISSAAPPVTKAAAILVPVAWLYPPWVFVVIICVPGAAKSGLIRPSLVKPLPDEAAI